MRKRSLQVGGIATAIAFALVGLGVVPGPPQGEPPASAAGVVATIELPAGSLPEKLSVAPASRRAYLSEAYTHRLRVIDLDTRSTVALLDLGTEPGPPTVAPGEALVYLAVLDPPRIRIIDASSLQVVDGVDAANPTFVLFAPDGQEFYIACDDPPPTMLRAIGTATKTARAEVGIGPPPGTYVVSPDGLRIFVACDDGPDDYHTNLRVINRYSFTVTSVIALEGGGGAAFAFSPDGSKLYVGRPQNNTRIQVIDVAAEQLDSNYPEGIALPDEPRGIWVNADGTRAYVALGRYDGAGRLAVVNLTTAQLVTLIDMPDLDMVSDGAYIPDKQEVWLVQPGPMVEQEDGSWHRTGDGRIVIVDVSGL